MEGEDWLAVLWFGSSCGGRFWFRGLGLGNPGGTGQWVVLLGFRLLAVGEVLLAFVFAHFEGIWGLDGGTLEVGAKGVVEGKLGWSEK